MKYEEDNVQVSICRWLDMGKYVYTFTGGGLIHNVRTQRTANRLGYRKGVSDLVVWVPNGTVCIECKKPAKYRYSAKLKRLVIAEAAGRQTDEQKAFQAAVTGIVGHYYLEAMSVDDVIEFFRSHKF